MLEGVTQGPCRRPDIMFLPLVLILLVSAGLARSQEIRPAEAGGDELMKISLKYYNPQNQSTWLIRVLEPLSMSAVTTEAVPSDINFYVFQVHSYLHDISLSYNNTLLPHYHVNGTNVGLVWKTIQGIPTFYVSNPNPENVTVMYAIVAYGAYSPVPGGCNMEFEVETAPYLKVSHSDAVVEVNAQPSVAPGSSCTKEMVIHEFHRMYMSEKDFSEELYFAAIQSMLTPLDILENGHLAPVPVYGSTMRRLYSLYAGTGSVYVVIAHSLTGMSAYVPAVSYGCSAVFFTDSCSVLSTTFSKVLCACVLFLGGFAFLKGHLFFRTHIFLAGFLSGSLLAYIGLSQWTAMPFSSGVTLSCVVGLGVGMAYLLFWYLCGIPVVAILLMVMPLGFLIASVLFFSGLGDVQFAQLDLDFWLAFLLVMLGTALLMLPLLQHASIISCAVVGAYAFVVPFDHYIGGNLKYIIINTLRRASVPGFSLAIIDPPFQAADGLLALLWALLALIGVRTQQVQQAGRPPFPPSSRAAPPLALPRPHGPRAPGGHDPTARTPLLVSSRIPFGYGSVGDDDVFETPPPAVPAPAPAAPAAAADPPRTIADWVGRGLGLRDR